MRTIGYHYFFAWGLASTKNIYSHNKKSSTNKLTILTIHQLKRHELTNLQPKQRITLKINELTYSKT